MTGKTLFARAESERPFALQRAPLLRVALVRLASADGLGVHPAAAALPLTSQAVAAPPTRWNPPATSRGS